MSADVSDELKAPLHRPNVSRRIDRGSTRRLVSGNQGSSRRSRTPFCTHTGVRSLTSGLQLLALNMASGS